MSTLMYHKRTFQIA